MKYCQQCVLPDTRPGLVIGNDRVCNACKSGIEKRVIDWNQREEAFRELVARAKSKEKMYDCVIPVSGGKDSTWQVVKCLEYGLHPLAVTWKSPARTEIGWKNLENLIGLGVDHIDYQINPRTESVFMLKALESRGSTAIPMHMALFALPLQIAVKFDIPLVIWGENSAFEYGGDDDAEKTFNLDSRWVERYGVTQGTVARDWISSDLTSEALVPYSAPEDAELKGKGILAVFMGYYFKWDPEESLRVALSHGFTVRQEGPKTGYYNYADIDDDFISIHHWLKWYKFGFTRTWDNLALEIRNGRMVRDEAISIIRGRGDETPHEDIGKFCRFVGITRADFFSITEKFRNREIWFQDQGVWKMRDFLIADWNW
ncbi:MAG TPA: N-acetyl sugar amidotransferase [Syntrophorhabdales bacterium]|nr:N-acetyl sugar amidotransferase [Syntrophorhabdales bacterium]